MSASRSGSVRSLTFLNTVLLATAFSVPAFAQIETVVVTAEKRAEDLQTVPVAVTAISGDDLKKKEIQTFKDLQFNVPNLTYQKSALGGGSVTIRGIGQVAGDPGISQYNNGIFTEASDLQTADYFDLKSIEVLRGPQGTLYGRASVGGLINAISNNPDLENLTASGDFTYGEYNTMKGTGVVNIPLTDTLAVRFAGQYTGHNGYITNLAPGYQHSLDSQNVYSGRFSARWEPTDRTTIDVVAEYSSEADTRDRTDGNQCDTDPTGVLGCLPNKQTFGPPNNLSNAIGVLDSRQWMGVIGQLVGLGYSSAFGVNITKTPFTSDFDLSGGSLGGAGGPIGLTFAALGSYGDLSAGNTFLESCALNPLCSVAVPGIGTVGGNTHNFANDEALFIATLGALQNAGAKAALFDLTGTAGELGSGLSPSVIALMPKKIGQVYNQNNNKFDEFGTNLSAHVNQKLNSWLTVDILGGYHSGRLASSDGYTVFPPDQYNDTHYANSFTADVSAANCNDIDPTTGLATGSHCNPVTGLVEWMGLAGGGPANPNLGTQIVNALGHYFPNYGASGAAELFPFSNFMSGGIVNVPATLGTTGNGIRSFVTGTAASNYQGVRSRESSAEMRFTSSLDGPFNFTAGMFYYDNNGYRHNADGFRVPFNGGDYWSIFNGALADNSFGSTEPSVGVDPYYFNSPSTKTESKAAYFDVSYELPGDLTFKGGLRWQEDRNQIWNEAFNFADFNASNCLAFCYLPAGSDPATLAAAHALENAGGAPGPVVTTDRVNGRALLQWTPKLDFTDQTLVYASYAKGSKAGTVNLVGGIALAEGVPASVAPEDLTSYELGTKNTLLDGTLQANVTLWYYQYKNFQYTVTEFASLVTQNLNAHMYGLEAEFIWQPDEHWSFNANVSDSNSSISSGQFAIDARNPTNGATNAVLIKDYELGAADFPAQNCTVITATGIDPASDTDVTTYYAGKGLTNPFLAPAAGATALQNPNPLFNVQFANFGTCSNNFGDPNVAGTLNNYLNTVHATTGVTYYQYTSPLTGTGDRITGKGRELGGKNVPNLPPVTFSIGGQYTFDIDGYHLAPRVDYYMQTGYFSSVFNDPIDSVSSWDTMNLQLMLTAPDARWYAKAFATNVFDKRSILGVAYNADNAGLGSIVQAEDPRIVGVTIGAHY